MDAEHFEDFCDKCGTSVDRTHRCQLQCKARCCTESIRQCWRCQKLSCQMCDLQDPCCPPGLDDPQQLHTSGLYSTLVWSKTDKTPKKELPPLQRKRKYQQVSPDERIVKPLRRNRNWKEVRSIMAQRQFKMSISPRRIHPLQQQGSQWWKSSPE